jgi:hypothetical protein
MPLIGAAATIGVCQLISWWRNEPVRFLPTEITVVTGGLR